MPRIIKPAVGAFTAANITVDSSGRVITAASGASATNMLFFNDTAAPTSGAQGNYATTANTSKINVYLRGGGGGGGGGQQGGVGGFAGFGAFSIPVSSAPATFPYVLGAGGGQQPDPNIPGASGGESTFDTNHSAEGGGGGRRGPSPGLTGTPGDAGPNAIIDYTQPTNALTTPFYEAFPIVAPPGNVQAGSGGNSGGTGNGGGFKIFEDVG
tara:strand:- start:1159 stop:1794 length:636 start_codon:yes stop_codon:yes gene_type:complete